MSTIDHLKKEAKDWLREVRRNNPGPVKRLRLAYPAAPGQPVLRDVQHALARERGYESWVTLKASLELQSAQAGTQPDDDLETRFLRLACWDHTVHGRASHERNTSAAVRLVTKL